MKKMVAVLSGAVLVFLLGACNLSNLMKGGEETTNETVNAPAEPTPPAKPRSSGGQATAPKHAAAPANENVEPAPPKKIPKAGLGVIFVSNLKSGTFKVKSDKEKLVDHSFQTAGGLRSKETRLERELRLPAGTHTLKFVVLDNQGSKGVKMMTMVFEPKSHHVVKVIAKGAPGDMVVQMIE